MYYDDSIRATGKHVMINVLLLEMHRKVNGLVHGALPHF